MHYCGIDIVKYKHEATVIDEGGKALLDSLFFRGKSLADQSPLTLRNGRLSAGQRTIRL